ncbi:MAG: hypothetical protein AAF870_00025 [Pseudomonadota bacterium]
MKPSFLALLLVLFAGTTAAANDVGLNEVTISVPHHEQKMQMAIMYPAVGQKEIIFAENAVFYGTSVFKDAKPITNRHPVVLLSHGWGGNYARMAWLSAGLVSRGAIVVSVNHPNSTTNDLDFNSAYYHWTRAKDMSAALDYILQDPIFAPLVELSEIYATGFSYGGWTALSLAGVKGSRDGFIDYCEAAGTGSQFCAELTAEGIDIAAIDQDEYEASYRDPRIKGVAAIDPGLTWGLGPEDVQDVTIPLLLVGLGEGADRLNATDTSTTGSGFETLVPQASVKIIAPATHFTALGKCRPAGAAILIEEQDDPVCTDPEGTDRTSVLETTIDALAHHFELN